MIGENGFESLIWFMGFVEDNADPLNGRVRVRAFGFHPPYSDGTVLTEDLPWAHVVRDSKFSSIPDLGDLVIGFFLDGRDAQHPVVIGVVNSAKYSAPAAASYLPSVSNTPEYAVVPPGGTITQQEAYSLALQAGFNPAEAKIMAAISVAESGLNTNAHNTNSATGDNSYGLWQINMIGALGPERQKLFGIRSNNELFDPLTNAKAAYAIYKQQGFNAWSVYKNNSYSKYLNNIPGVNSTGDAIEGVNPYLAPSQDAVMNYGNPAMPPAIHGENFEFTPALVSSAARRSTTTSGGAVVDEPGVPPPGGKDTSVWETRYGGSSIVMSGKNTSDEFIHITHANGSRVTIDGNGNITIKAMGKLHLGSESNIEENADGAKVGVYPKGYSVEITDGKCNITSTGDMNLTSKSNLNINVGGSLAINVGESIDIAGARVAMTAKVDALDLLAAKKVVLESSGGSVGIKSVSPLYLQASGEINIKSGGQVKVGGSQIHLNSPGSAPADAITAVAASTATAEAPEKGVVSDDTAAIDVVPTGISVDMTDEPSVDFSNAMG